MHDMLRDICIKKSAQDMFLNGPNKFRVSNPRRMSFHKLEDDNDSTESMSLIRSVICIGFWNAEFPFGTFLAAILVRVLDLDMQCNSFPTEIFELVNLRFLGIGFSSRIPRGISRLWNLQSLIAPYSKFDEPVELWKLSELRNVKLFGFELLKDEERNCSVMKKLQRISFNIYEKEATIWDGFHKSIPNIKKLCVYDFVEITPTAMDLSQLHKLESLRCSDIKSISSPDGFGRRFRVIFPCNIRKLVLLECEMILGAWRTLCALHKLEVLRIIDCNFKSKEETCDEEREAADGDEFESEEGTCDEEWELADGDVFCSLQFLSLQGLNVVHWLADETNFPRLRHLSLYGCDDLEEIPSGIGEIPTLQLIEVEYCSESAVDSAERIKEE
ncbi:putative late blight resistance protein homolog R1B-14 [Salvia hispanica]|uniref:putative late blight resistance protein homolog R1B-14 n=1 Tax=Salvia hispanica TaxID=49212 RepID=UPI002008F886|nr:putative late blight resistance protein homolog R1B-14 [Salvia hispanica]